ncbi:MAG: hypothetical protein HC828_12280 [Blastochloris sp.]|nr:hypothetical protein [Blastochloris sp.]
MFFLVTGASGVGKSTVRRRLAKTFRDVLISAELATLGLTPAWSLRWRHQAVELAVQRARFKGGFLAGVSVVPTSVRP